MDLKQGQFIMEYVGEVINSVQYKERMAKYEEQVSKARGSDWGQIRTAPPSHLRLSEPAALLHDVPGGWGFHRCCHAWV